MSRLTYSALIKGKHETVFRPTGRTLTIFVQCTVRIWITAIQFIKIVDIILLFSPHMLATIQITDFLSAIQITIWITHKNLLFRCYSWSEERVLVPNFFWDYSKNGSFWFLMALDHLNPKLVGYSDRDCHCYLFFIWVGV